MTSDSDDDFSDFEDDQEVLAIMAKRKQQIMSVQQTLLVSGQIAQTKEKIEIAKIMQVVKDYIRSSMNNIPYTVEGGRAVAAWLNPNNKGLTPEEILQVETTDYDISVLTSQEECRSLIKKMHRDLERLLKMKLDIRDDDILKLRTHDIWVYQIGIPDPKSTEWVIDVHPGKYKESERVAINGIYYPKLKYLISSIDDALRENPTKTKKRITRKSLLLKAMEDMSNFNPKFFNKRICRECLDKGKEELTGYGLDCEKVLPFCDDQKKKDMEKKLAKLRADRLRQLQKSE